MTLQLLLSMEAERARSNKDWTQFMSKQCSFCGLHTLLWCC